MPVTLELCNSKVLRMALVSPWTVDELFGAYPEAERYFEEAPGKLTTIVDIVQIGHIPPGALRARRSPFMNNPKSDLQIIVGTQNFARSMAEIVFKLANFKRVKFCNSTEEAWAVVNAEAGQSDMPDNVEPDMLENFGLSVDETEKVTVSA